MAGKRLPQNNQPVVSPTDFQERRAKKNAEEAQRARVEHLQKRVRELEAAEIDYTATIQTLQAEKETLGAQLLSLQKENEHMKKQQAHGADKPLDDPINEDDLTLKKEPAKARQLPKKKEAKDKDKEEKSDNEEL